MINLYNQVPTIYTNASRDFQYLCWLFNIVLNDVKHNIDGLYDLPNNKTDLRLTELLALTLGFKVKRNYDQKQLAALVSIIPRIMRYKGTIEAVRMAGEALISVSGTSGTFEYKLNDDKNLLQVILPKELVDANLFIDLLPYIMPAGMTFRIVRKTQKTSNYVNYYDYQSILQAEFLKHDVEWDSNTQTFTGVTGLYGGISENSVPEFTNFDKDKNLNAGLMDNTIIPVLEDTLGAFETPSQDTNLEVEEYNE